MRHNDLLSDSGKACFPSSKPTAMPRRNLQVNKSMLLCIKLSLNCVNSINPLSFHFIYLWRFHIDKLYSVEKIVLFARSGIVRIKFGGKIFLNFRKVFVKGGVASTYYYAQKIINNLKVIFTKVQLSRIYCF